MKLTKLKVGVLVGGISQEREVSLSSGRCVFLSLQRNGFGVKKIDITTDCVSTVRDILLKGKIDLAFIALHGKFGEDGQIQMILEDLHIPYTGSGPLASQWAMDKIMAKNIFIENNIPTPNFFVLDNSPKNFSGNLPEVIKPSSSGSSIGVSIVRKHNDWSDAVSQALAIDDKIIVEEYIRGKELTVGILDDQPLSVIEIIPTQGYFNFTTKYNEGLASFNAPVSLNNDVYKKVMSTAACAHQVLGCRHFSRVDIILNNQDIPFVLEVNSIPGFTSHSLLPLSARVCGVEFEIGRAHV